MRVLIIGVGNMGATYVRCLLHSHFTQPENLFLFDKKELQQHTFKNVLPQNIISEAGTQIGEADIILLAVKPQDFDALATQIAPFLHAEQIVLSIMAGVKMEHIAKRLHTHKVVRAMPNLPAQIGMGITVFSSSSALDKKEVFIIQNLLSTTGKAIYVESEQLLDAATAISGSGPAYVFYFMNEMIAKATSLGFNKSEAELMVMQTFFGAVHLLSRNELSCEEWIAKVASKGGTTEAALKSFKETDLRQSINKGVQAAFERAVELGN
ncbi:MAG: pyrroline-5-carboxylate reductase [Chitinophagales bacterium]|nr:pyrroline-5-carboxylate reductase [Chitinophagales bacterium]